MLLISRTVSFLWNHVELRILRHILLGNFSPRRSSSTWGSSAGCSEMRSLVSMFLSRHKFPDHQGSRERPGLNHLSATIQTPRPLPDLQLWRELHWLNFLPVPLAAGRRGRSFKDVSPPSHLQVGGILGWYYHKWEKHGEEGWTVEIFRSGYHIPFYPSVTQEPIKFPYYSSGPVKAQALQEVDKMLRKGALEEVEN